MATRFRAELKPGRNPKKLLRVYGRRGQHEQAGMGWRKASDNPGLPHLSGSWFWVTLSFKPWFPSLDNGQMQPASHGRKERSSFESPKLPSTAPISQMGKLRLREGLWLAEGHKIGKELKSAPPHLGREGRVSTLPLRALPPHPESTSQI